MTRLKNCMFPRYPATEYIRCDWTSSAGGERSLPLRSALYERQRKGGSQQSHLFGMELFVPVNVCGVASLNEPVGPHLVSRPWGVPDTPAMPTKTLQHEPIFKLLKTFVLP